VLLQKTSHAMHLTLLLLSLVQLLLQAPSALYLPDALDTWESFAGSGSGKGARLYQGPYALAAIRPRPIMLDSAAGACSGRCSTAG
jgi:hypothetical protein